MASSELIIRDYNLETEFLGSCVRHTTYHPNTTQGERLVKAVKTWSRGRKLGHGSSGTVFLEWSEEGELRAVKDIQKNVDNRIKTDYRLELAAMAALAKVRDRKASRTARYLLSLADHITARCFVCAIIWVV